MVEIVLVRHASTAWSGRRYCGRSDPSLSRAGRLEATALAARLAATLRPGTRIIASPSRRTVATAEAMAAAADHLTIERDPRWMEIDFGRAEGRTFAELSSIAPDIAKAILAGDTDIDWPDGETSASLGARIAEAWDELTRDGRPAIVVTHAGPILCALALSRQGQTTAADLPAPASAIRIRLPAPRASRDPVLPSPA